MISTRSLLSDIVVHVSRIFPHNWFGNISTLNAADINKEWHLLANRLSKVVFTQRYISVSKDFHYYLGRNIELTSPTYVIPHSHRFPPSWSLMILSHESGEDELDRW